MSPGCDRVTFRVQVATLMFSNKPATTAALSVLAMYCLPVPPSLAQEFPVQPSHTVAPQQPARPPVTIKCPNGHNYRLTTGNNGGVCKVYLDHGKVIGGFCTDGTNSALQTCSTGCKETTGSGACEKQDPSGSSEWSG